VDVLLNFETVTLCGNSGLEVRQYDTTLTQYQVGTACCVCCVMWQLSRRWGRQPTMTARQQLTSARGRCIRPRGSHIVIVLHSQAC